MVAHALVGARVFDGRQLCSDQAVVLDGLNPTCMPIAHVPADMARITLKGGIILPGFVDLQVNGGGGVMFNSAPTCATLETIAQAHAPLGTRAFLPTLITDTPEVTTAAIDAVERAIAKGVPGILGLHLEGPHLSVARKGAHDGALIRAMTVQDLQELLSAAERLPNLMVTLAPESVTQAQISTLSQAGVCVSLGHTDCDYDTAMRAFAAGATCSTHLFNAMSGLTSRAPGLVGATLDALQASAGLIADGIHVHPATIRAALAAHRAPGEIFLVTDAMASAGSGITRFDLNGRTIERNQGRLTLEDRTLAGADLSMARAVQVMVQDAGDPLERALARATSIPASLLRRPDGAGTWPDSIDDLIYLGPDYTVSSVRDLM
ncbi:MAG: N-acetylglucosamine-6-phosphate deacetylase [Sulfitobacter sp.]